MAAPPDSSDTLLHSETVELPAVPPPVIGIEPYTLMEKIGQGGMGEIYLAEDPRLHRRVALKLLPEHFTQNADRVRRFIQEAQAASALNHPNIITIFEIGDANGVHYMVTEYIEGQTLRRQITERLSTDRALDVAIQIAGALKAAHEAGIIHRDIKPENVMVRPDGLVKLLDFGIAKLVERPSLSKPSTAGTPPATSTREDPSAADNDPDGGTFPDGGAPEESLNETAPGIIMGTVTYMSPEQLRGLKVDARADIFSLGVVLYEVIAGQSPFAASTQVDIISAILEREPARLTDQRPETPPEFERIISRSLQKDREARYQRVDDMLAELTDLKQDLAFRAKLGQTTAVRTTIVAAIERHRRSAWLLLAMLMAAAIGVGYLVLGGGKAGVTSIAVLPFKNVSNDPEKEFLSDGISESLISRLSQLPGLKVIANSSSARYKDQPADPQEVARALNITCILTGRVQQLGDRLAISVELIDARDRTLVWGERYDRKAMDLLAVQAEISREITDKLRLRLTSGQKPMARAEIVKPEAYELLLKGRFHRSRGGAGDRKKAADYFNQAIAIDPTYAPAYADLADMYRSLIGSSLLDPKEYLPKAEAAARKAVELDAELADAHYALANLKTNAWEWAEAEREYKRAIELNPNLALAHRWYASYLRLVSRHEQAIEEIKRARELDPLSPGVNATVGYIFFSARQYDQSIQDLKNTLGLDGDYPYTHLFLGFNYAATGMYEKAILAYQQAIELGLDTASTQINLGAACAGAGDVERARAILKRLQTSKDYVSPGELAILYTALGEREQAFASLEKAYEAHDLQLQYLGVNPGFDPLRTDPRFGDLLRRVGLSD